MEVLQPCTIISNLVRTPLPNNSRHTNISSKRRNNPTTNNSNTMLIISSKHRKRHPEIVNICSNSRVKISTPEVDRRRPKARRHRKRIPLKPVYVNSRKTNRLRQQLLLPCSG